MDNFINKIDVYIKLVRSSNEKIQSLLDYANKDFMRESRFEDKVDLIIADLKEIRKALYWGKPGK